MSTDHYIARGHLKLWATDPAQPNRVSVLRRGEAPKLLDVGKMVAAEAGLNHPKIEAAYGKIESRAMRAIRRLVDHDAVHTRDDWKAIRHYAVLLHDRYPALRGSAEIEQGMPGASMLMVPNPANWGGDKAIRPFPDAAASMFSREQLKASRLQMLELNAQVALPAMMQVLHGWPMIIGDAGIHSITLHPDAAHSQTFVAMPLSPTAALLFGDVVSTPIEVLGEVMGMLVMKIAMESTIVIDTPERPVITALVEEMWHYPGPEQRGVPQAVHVWSNLADVSATR